MKVEFVRVGVGYYIYLIVMMKNQKFILEVSGVIKDFCVVEQLSYYFCDLWLVLKY